MINFLIVNIWLTIFLYLSFFTSSYRPRLKKAEKISVRLPSVFLLSFILIGLVVLLHLFSAGLNTLLDAYIKLSFSALAIGSALWLTMKQAMKIKAISVGAALLLISWRFITRAQLTHNLFIMIALVWLGSFFTSIKLLTKRRFIIISLIWFIYDLVFVWLSPLADRVQQVTEAIRFPLHIASGDAFLGSADLLWANLLLVTLTTYRHKMLAIIALVASNLILGFYSYFIDQIHLFPLLVLWVPIGLLILFSSVKY